MVVMYSGECELYNCEEDFKEIGDIIDRSNVYNAKDTLRLIKLNTKVNITLRKFESYQLNGGKVSPESLRFFGSVNKLHWIAQDVVKYHVGYLTDYNIRLIQKLKMLREDIGKLTSDPFY